MDANGPLQQSLKNVSDEFRESLRGLAELLGLSTRYHDFYGNDREVALETLLASVTAMGFDASNNEALTACLARAQTTLQDAGMRPGVVVLRKGESFVMNGRTVASDSLDLGYHHIDECTVIVCPPRAWQPQGLIEGGRWWGACIQLYALRSRRNWGIGDFTDLARLVEILGARGAAFVGLNPLHALFAHRPNDASPYSPSSRNALNPLYLDVEAMPDFHESREARARADSEDTRRRIEELRDADEVAYAGVSAIKYSMFELMWKSFSERHIARDSTRANEWRAFMAQHPHLQDHAVFEALQAHLFAADHAVWGWPAWPVHFQDPAGAAVAQFRAEHADRVGFHGWLQWQADVQLRAAQDRARNAGMSIGLYRDLAVGSNEGGSELWTGRDSYALGMHVGAPPDPLSEAGQDWGLPPLDPIRLRDSRYAAFIDLIRANMRHAGALRLDHVMGLMRLFWTGEHGGTYMRYPLDDLLGILALESHRNQCMVIGEDLGNVAPSMREAMKSNALLSYSPLYFERGQDGSFKPPSEWKPGALAVIGTHDLPTFEGYWQGEDIALASKLNLYPDASTHARQIVERAQARAQLLLALEGASLLPEGTSAHPAAVGDGDITLVAAIYAYLSQTPCQLVGVQLEDVTQQLQQVNVPGTTEGQYPNWRKKIPVALEDLAIDKRLNEVVVALKNRNSSRLPDGERSVAPANFPIEVPDLSSAHVPDSTYRVQFHAGFTFDDATRIVPYLCELGVSHLYASPWQAARAGSTHGYDVVDPNTLNPELGDEASFERLCTALSSHNMRQMLDIVPNHMGVLEAENPWWLDVLEHGHASLHAETFDIEWNPPATEMAGRILLPVLGDQYGKVLEAGDLELKFDPAEGAFSVHYYKHHFPIDPRDYAMIVSGLPAGVSAEETASIESLLHAFAQMPPRNDTTEHARATRARDARLLKRRLARRVSELPQMLAWIEACVASFKGTTGNAQSFDALDRLIAQQAWRLAFWRVAGDDINYRRFFDINTLAALRMEREQVFEATHRRVLRWLQDGSVAALRIDHPDGLADPRAYFERLQSRQAHMAELAGGERRAVYLVVEKILGASEDLPADWPVHGGTGYRFSNLVNGLFVDTRNEGAMTRLYAEFADAPTNFTEMLYSAKKMIMDVALASDLQWLTEALYRISRADRRTCDFTRNRLRAAIAEVAAEFTVYRTYLIGDGTASEADRRYLDQAVRRAKRRGLAADVSVLDHLRDVLLSPPPDDEFARVAHKSFIARWQQFTAPVMAKAMEDTAFYRYHRLISLNDVGGDPRNFGVTPHEFHVVCESQAATRPHWLLGSSTHDSKRSEDLRARLDVLSEMPDEWRATALEWQAANLQFTLDVQGSRAPTRNDEYLLYQTLVGVWPVHAPKQTELTDLKDRVQAYMLKAMREAKLETSWINPDEMYENAVAAFIDSIFKSGAFLNSLSAFVARIAPYGFSNSLNLVTLKLTAPGVPDVYQGCERWAFNLVDPDNRRPVDFDALRDQLSQLQSLYRGKFPSNADWLAMHEGIEDGRLKQLITWRLLHLRQEHREVFHHGSHEPLHAIGDHAANVVSYSRISRCAEADQRVVVVASRLAYSRAKSGNFEKTTSWGDTAIALPESASGLTDWLTGHRVTSTVKASISELFKHLPVAVLVSSDWMKK